MKRIIGATLALLFVVVTFVATSSPSQVSATPTWPLKTAVYPQFIRAIAEDNISVYDCGSAYGTDARTGAPAQTFVQPSAVKQSSIYSYSTGSYLPALEPCGPNGNVTTEDGSFFGTMNVGGTAHAHALFKERNGRIVWQNVDEICPSSTEKTGSATNMAMGANGLLYVILAGWCGEFFVVIDPLNGEMLTTPYALASSGSYSRYLSTYEEEVVLRDRSGTVYYFENGGDLITGTSYSTASSYPIYNAIWMDENQTVYTIKKSTSSCYDPLTVSFKTRGGTAGSYNISLDNGCNFDFATDAVPLPDGGVAVRQTTTNPKITAFDNTGTGSSLYGSTPSGFYTGGFGLTADTDGNIIYVGEEVNNSTYKGNVVVHYYDFGGSTVTELWDGLSVLTGTTDNLSATAASSVVDGDLYLPLCYGTTCYLNHQNAWIHKIPLTGFGDVYRFGGTFVQPDASTKLQYVAMGDSYSSGEGNPPFIEGTNQETNKCHRSAGGAYSQILAGPIYTGLNLELTELTACAGATTSDILWGGASDGSWDEDPQVYSLLPTTDVVTITAGGNDAAFSDYATICVLDIINNCGEGSESYVGVMTIIEGSSYESNLTDVYNEILGRVTNPDADIYVVGYPYVTPLDASDWACIPFQGVSTGSSVNDSIAARQVVDALNGVSANIVNSIRETDDRIHFVNVNFSGSPFEDHDVCAAEPYFVGLDGGTTSSSYFHPNTGGQNAYAEILADVISD